MPVFIKPLVHKELTQYVSGYGNKRDWKNYNTTLSVDRFSILPAPGMKAITFKATVKSEVPRDPKSDVGKVDNKVLKSGKIIKKRPKPAKTKKFINYEVVVQFFGMEYSEEETPKLPIKYKSGSRFVYTKTPSIKNNQCTLKCTCRDFMFVWEKPLADNNGLYPSSNAWTRYNRVTDHIPPVNPNEKMGYCKHIATFLKFLNEKKALRN
jgi:hypothetical protein